MPKRERSASTEVAVGELLVVAYIRSAYAGRLNLDLKLAGRRFFDASGFLMIGQTKIRLMYSAPEGEIFISLTVRRSPAPCRTLAWIDGFKGKPWADDTGTNTGSASAEAEGAIF
jgi:hypothetical protein